jgi:serine/threonine protein kinase
VRSDIFALGSVLYHALTGERPTCPAWQRSVTPALTLRADCPPELDRAISRALRRDPDFRWASARRFAEELSWLQARSGFGFKRRWHEEIGSGKHAIPVPRR